MFKVCTFINKNNEWYSDGVSYEEIQKDFLEFEDRKNRDEIVCLLKSSRGYGFVQIYFNDEEILGSKEFGTITDMWSVFTGLISSYLCDGKASKEFPDYMLKIRLYNFDENHVIIELPEISKTYNLPKTEFITSWIKGAISFYESLAYYDFFLMKKKKQHA